MEILNNCGCQAVAKEKSVTSGPIGMSKNIIIFFISGQFERLYF